MRIYVKENVEDTTTIRTELELKKEISKQIFRSCAPNVSERENLFATILTENLETGVATPLLAKAKETLETFDTKGEWRNQRTIKSPHASMEWFLKTTISVFSKYLENPRRTKRKIFFLFNEKRKF